MKKIGFIGGISWVSTLDYYRYVNEAVNKQLGGLDFAECAIYSINFGDLQRVGWSNAYGLLLDACEKVQQTGVDALVLCANTAHLFEEELGKAVRIPIISIVTETAKTVKESKLKTVGLIATKFTMELGFYRRRFEQLGLIVVTPEREEVRDYIQQTLRDELGRGIINLETKQKYIEIVNELKDKGAEGIILGCTEIPLILGEKDFAFPVFDSTTIHSNAIVKFILS